ncbi:MAG: amidohydrolase family protein, partial [Glaciecola sp.]
MIKNLSNRSKTAKVALVIAGLLMAAHTQAATHIFASKLITSEDSKIQNDKTVIVEDNKIISIIDGKDEGGEGDTFIDLTGSTLMPGLMDMHVHLSFQNEGPSSYLKSFTSNEADYAIAAVDYARKTVMAGFTTVRNLGDVDNETVALRKSINQGVTVGPRIYTAAKSIATTGGHADPTNGRSSDLMGNPGPRDGV